MEEKDYMISGASLSLMIVTLTGGGGGGGGSMTGESMGVAEVMSTKGTLVAMTTSVTLTCTMHQAPSIKERRNVIGRGFIRMTILRPEVIQVVQEEGQKVEGPLILMVLWTVSAPRGGGGGDGLVAVTVGASILRREEKDGDIIQKKEKNLSKARNASSRKSGRQLIKIQLRRDLLKS